MKDTIRENLTIVLVYSVLIIKKYAIVNEKLYNTFVEHTYNHQLCNFKS